MECNQNAGKRKILWLGKQLIIKTQMGFYFCRTVFVWKYGVTNFQDAGNAICLLSLTTSRYTVPRLSTVTAHQPWTKGPFCLNFKNDHAVTSSPRMGLVSGRWVFEDVRTWVEISSCEERCLCTSHRGPHLLSTL